MLIESSTAIGDASCRIVRLKGGVPLSTCIGEVLASADEPQVRVVTEQYHERVEASRGGRLDGALVAAKTEFGEVDQLMRSSIKAIEATVADLRASHDALVEANRGLEKTVKAATAAVRQTPLVVAGNFERMIDSVKVAISSEAKWTSDVKRRFLDAMKLLNSACDTAADARKTVLKEREENNKKMGDLLSEMRKLKSDCDAAVQAVDTAEGERKRIEKRLENAREVLDAKTNSLAQSNTAAIRRREKLESERGVLEKDFKAYEAERKAANTLAETLRTRQQSLEQKRERLQRDCDQNEEKRKRLLNIKEEVLPQMQREVSRVQAEVKSLDAEGNDALLNSLRGELKQLLERRAEAKDQKVLVDRAQHKIDEATKFIEGVKENLDGSVVDALGAMKQLIGLFDSLEKHVLSAVKKAKTPRVGGLKKRLEKAKSIAKQEARKERRDRNILVRAMRRLFRKKNIRGEK